MVSSFLFIFVHTLKDKIMKALTREQLVSKIASTGGKFFSVTFIKKNGEERLMNARTGVVKSLNGGQSNLDASKYITVFDVQADGYRAVNKDTIKQVVFGGESFKLV